MNDMELSRILALISLLVAGGGTVLLFLSPSPPQLYLLFASGIAFLVLLVVAFALWVPEEEEALPEREEEASPAREEEPKPEEELLPQPGAPSKEEITSKLKEALEALGGELLPEAPRKPRPETLSLVGEFSPPGWKPVGEGETGEEILREGKPEGGVRGFFRILEKEGKRLALYAFSLPSPEAAEARLREILEKLGPYLYERLPQLGRFFLEGMDGAVGKKGEVVVLLLAESVGKGEASEFLKLLPEELRPGD